MNILVVGNGAREHAIAWKLRQSSMVEEIYLAPGNAGTTDIARNLPISIGDIEQQADAAITLGIDLTIVGPEIPLAAGISDLFADKGLAVFGPTSGAARIESSKIFAKNLMAKYLIPTGGYRVFSSFDEACEYVRSHEMPLVVKADGLAAGKGVTVASTLTQAIDALADCLVEKTFGSAGDYVLVEECLRGQEVSVFCFSDGTNVSQPIAACDYKRAHDGDLGPNTGGMGSYSPPMFWNDELEREIQERIMLPIIAAMASEGYPYKGVIYAGIMVTDEGPKVLEFNCRFGDPETQVIIPRLSGDLADIAFSVARGNLTETPILWDEDVCVGVVMASGGYPEAYNVGELLTGLAGASNVAQVFHSGTKRGPQDSQEILTDGGRVLTVVGRGETVYEARRNAYAGISEIHFEHSFYRTDIASLG